MPPEGHPNTPDWAQLRSPVQRRCDRCGPCFWRRNRTPQFRVSLTRHRATEAYAARWGPLAPWWASTALFGWHSTLGATFLMGWQWYVSKEGRTVAPLVYPSKSGQSSKPTNPMTDKGPRSVPCFWQYLSEIKMPSTRHPVEAVDTMPTSLSCRDVIELIDATPYVLCKHTYVAALC